MQELAIDARSVGMTYLDDNGIFTVLDDVTFSVEAHEAVALIGPSGCGKSTFLRLACSLASPTSGELEVFGQKLDKPRMKTAYIPQTLGLLPWKTNIDNAALGLEIHGMPRKQALAKAHESLAEVGLSDFCDRYPAELSGGMKQRLAIARALALDVDLLLMDEPLSALDAILREQMQGVLLDVWKTRRYAQVIVTHSIEEAVRLGRRIIVFGSRPGHVAQIMQNDGFDADGYFNSHEFSDMCIEVRSALDSAIGVLS